MHFLVTLWDGGGTVPVEIGLVRRLAARGHTVTVLADPTVEADAIDAGAEFRRWTRAPHRRSFAVEDDLFRDWECRNPVQLLDRLCDRMMTAPAGRYAADVLEALQERPAAAVVSSGTLLGAQMAAESRGLPTVLLMANVYQRPAPGLPPFGTGLAPGRGPLGGLRDRALNGVVTRLWNRRLPEFNAARAELGLDPVDDLFAQFDRAFRVLVLTSPAFDFAATRLPDNVRYVGPVLDDPVWATPVDLPAGAGPLVAVGLSSTYMQQADVLRRIVAALDILPVRGVVTTGPALDPAEVPGTERVRVVRSAPHAQLFAASDVVITHAGHGTLMKALAAGVPALCLPMGRDQGGNLVRAARHGAVIGLKPSAPPARIAAAVRQLLDEPSYRLAARRLGERIRSDAATSRLVEEVEAVSGGHAAGRSAPAA
jgi:UDP:flavonoid glycosyltransferase YjiC (YdhE family)